MKVSPKDVLHIARLANLGLTKQECRRMVQDLSSILDYFNRLNELDTTDVPPMTEVKGPGELGQAMRDDTLLPCLTHEEALHNAPSADDKFFKVPKVLNK